jgi:hypothetical protein
VFLANACSALVDFTGLRRGLPTLGIAVPFAPALLTLLVRTLVARLSGRVRRNPTRNATSG